MKKERHWKVKYTCRVWNGNCGGSVYVYGFTRNGLSETNVKKQAADLTGLSVKNVRITDVKPWID